MTSPLRVAFDATSLLGSKTGVGYFAEALLHELARRDDVDVVAFPVSIRGRNELTSVVPDGVSVATPPIPARVAHRWWQHCDWPPIDRLIHRPDVVHGPNFVVPPSRAAQVVTVHDLTVLRFPELADPATRAFPRLITRAVDRGAVVHADSDAVKADLIERLGIPDDQIVTVHLGYRHMGGGDADRGRQIAGRDDFALAVGTVEPRKDLPTLLGAVDRLDRGGVAVPVVHVGPDGWGLDAFESALGSMRNPQLITRLGWRSDEDLRDLYAAARLVAYPSVYEGFGLPVLEAMSSGTPVLTTTDPAVVEVSGGAAVLVEVGDSGRMASALADLWENETMRSEHIAAGTSNLQRFSWRRCAGEMVDLYQRAAETNRN